ncbi:hypothetical protein GCM10010298_01390 [Streptomyces microflavus]|uniref:Alpha/beta hydrolase n=2 Tax=Streptomyces TaxID=1883 RepID=A0A7J0CPH1_STRMI|nr:hypothetical protein Smic_27540 [Streptomyces microflavus]GGX42393.1 hypothetical protein GCM10010298_01390 [Streptomyces microflavus]
MRCPALVVRAGKGMLKQPEADRMAGRHGATRIAVIPDAGHDVHLDDPAAVYGEMVAFLAEATAAESEAAAKEAGAGA